MRIVTEIEARMDSQSLEAVTQQERVVRPRLIDFLVAGTGTSHKCSPISH